MKKRVFTLLLVMAMCLTLCVPALAAGREVLGSPEDQTGYFLPDAPVMENQSAGLSPMVTRKFLFSITANQVRELLTTYNNYQKTVKSNNLTYGGVYLSGKINIHETPNTSGSAKVGLCYLDSFHDKFITEAGCYGYFTLGANDSVYIKKSALSLNTTYYAFIRNSSSGSDVFNGGYVAGSVTYYDADK